VRGRRGLIFCLLHSIAWERHGLWRYLNEDEYFSERWGNECHVHILDNKVLYKIIQTQLTPLSYPSLHTLAHRSRSLFTF
jgi:hypothetical protein